MGMFFVLVGVVADSVADDRCRGCFVCHLITYRYKIENKMKERTLPSRHVHFLFLRQSMAVPLQASSLSNGSQKEA